MKYSATLKFARVSPKKARLIANSFRKKNVIESETVLKYSPNKSAQMLLKLIKSALANVKDKKGEVEELIISEIKIDEGPIIKRRKIRSRGRTDLMKRRTSHFSIILESPAKKSKKESKDKKDVIDIKKKLPGKKVEKKDIIKKDNGVKNGSKSKSK
jgi:large subunit ribosomal protein L22